MFQGTVIFVTRDMGTNGRPRTRLRIGFKYSKRFFIIKWLQRIPPNLLMAHSMRHIISQIRELLLLIDHIIIPKHQPIKRIQLLIFDPLSNNPPNSLSEMIMLKYIIRILHISILYNIRCSSIIIRVIQKMHSR